MPAKPLACFAKWNVPISGIIENMAWFECAHGEKYPIFGEGGGAIEAARLGVPLLAQIPLDITTRQRSDQGQPIATLDPAGNTISAAFATLADSLIQIISRGA
jgi:ATP-binding protein involved in chromosome partitioning